MNDKVKSFLVRLGYYSKPDFIIIGAQKAGTTGLFYTLSGHSLIAQSALKEVHYFDNDDWYGEYKISQYHSVFPLPYTLKKR